jgi:Zn-dependent M28 family amino/carboxypeptidase
MAMLLYLANYFTTHPQKYSVMFIAFSGEEAELIGSLYFSKHPVAPLKSIKFLLNIDIMGDATGGITVVNATENPREFEELQKINNNGKYLPAVKSRGKAANSDHYHITEAGVPGFFIYSIGGPGFYHDIYDKPATLTLSHVGDVSKLIIEFLARYSI